MTWSLLGVVITHLRELLGKEEKRRTASEGGEPTSISRNHHPEYPCHLLTRFHAPDCLLVSTEFHQSTSPSRCNVHNCFSLVRIHNSSVPYTLYHFRLTSTHSISGIPYSCQLLHLLLMLLLAKCSFLSSSILNLYILISLKPYFLHSSLPIPMLSYLLAELLFLTKNHTKYLPQNLSCFFIKILLFQLFSYFLILIYFIFYIIFTLYFIYFFYFVLLSKI